MKFSQPLIAGTMIRRYKRFLADVRMDDGTVLTVHVPNSGSMKQCWAEGWPVRLSDSRNPARKLRYTLEMTHNGTCWIGVNTMHPNALAQEAILAGRLRELTGFTELKREVPYGTGSRVDLLGIHRASGQRCFIEVKNVTLLDIAGRYAFPDAVTLRGQKHLDELMHCVRAGDRAAMLFVIQRSDGRGFAPARDIDPVYADKLAQAHAVGVEILAYAAQVSPEGIELTGNSVPPTFAGGSST